ncbi:LysR family transcriptional regulator [Roseateles oligotrophus]|uniref:LysR family transcriptional regulator n=1 Tax=Roseateles oligotrophus TaxID=1769250 RepID=A0ABT2YB55_9BURK|nr:LysR family transcriptional regulator [Roseateles oligotrophus]MCV2367543.1 LysR family transcriptional regulator [Roseateles oligotrophus]
MIELRTLRQFLAVAEELHFGRAAERLHMTQPPLTQAIQKLEASLGAPLFERSSRSVALSAAGLALLPQARALLAQADALPALAQAAARGRRGRLRLGFVSTVGYGELPRWLRLFREAFADIELTLREATLDVQLREFEQNELDAGFIIHAPGAHPPGFERLKISSEAMVLALSAEDALAGAPGLDAAAVLTQPLVIFPRDIAPSLFDALLAFYRQHGQEPQIVQQAIQMQTIVNLVSAGIGVAWVPASVMAFQRAGVVYKPLAGAAPLCETSLIWRQDAAPTVLRFVEHIEQLMRR